MSSYELGKDIQSLHDKLDKLIDKKCGCSGRTSGPSSKSTVTLPTDVVAQLLEQFYFLVRIASKSDLVSTWDAFVHKYKVDPKGGLLDWCCRCGDNSFPGGKNQCTNITALGETDAFTNCSLGYCLSGSPSVTKDKCGPSDNCS